MPTPEELQLALQNYQMANAPPPASPQQWSPDQVSAFNRAVQGLPSHALTPPSAEPVSPAPVNIAPVVPAGVNPAPVTPEPVSPDPVAVGDAAPPMARMAPEPSAPAPTPQPPYEAPSEGGLPGALTALDTATNERVSAAEREGEAKASGADRAVEIFQGYRKEAEENLKKHRDATTAREAYVDSTLAAYHDLNKQIANTQIISKRTTAQKVMGVIGLAMTGLSDALAAGAGRNQNMMGELQQQITGMADRDIQLQRDALTDKKTQAQGMLTELGLARTLLGDTQEAFQFASAARKEQYGLALEEASQHSTSEATRAQFQGLGASFRQQAAQEKLDVYKTILKKKMSAFDIMMLKQAGFTDAQIREYMEQNGGDIPIGSGAPLPGGKLTKTQAGAVSIDAHRSGVPGLTPLTDDATKISKDDVEQAKKIKSAYNAARNALENLREEWTVIANPNASASKKKEAVAAYNSQLAVIPGYLSQISGSGTPQESETKRILSSIPSVPTTNDLDPANWMIRLENWRKDLPPDPFARNIKNLEKVTDGRLEGYWFRMGDEAPTAAQPSQPTSRSAPKKVEPKAPAPRTPTPKKPGVKTAW